MGFLVNPVYLDPKVTKDTTLVMACQACPVFLVLKVTRVAHANNVAMVTRVRRVNPAETAYLGHPVIVVCPAFVVKRDRRVNLVFRVLLA